MAALAMWSTAASAALAAGPFDREPDPADLVSMRLALQESALTPETTTLLAVVFDVEPGWHLYWKNAGDTGMPITIRSITTPPGVEVGEVFWPAPERFEHTGLVDYIYEGQVALFVQVRTAPTAAPIEGEVRVQAEWLVCRDACLPGSAWATARARVLPIGAVPRWNHKDAKTFEASLARLPRPAALTEQAGITARWVGLTLVLTAPGAEALTWFPDAPYDAPPAEPARDGAGAGETLRVEYDARARAFDRFTGVLAVRTLDRTDWYTVETSGPGGPTPPGRP